MHDVPPLTVAALLKKGTGAEASLTVKSTCEALLAAHCYEHSGHVHARFPNPSDGSLSALSIKTVGELSESESGCAPAFGFWYSSGSAAAAL